VARLNDDPQVHGFLVQMPLPRGWPEDRVLSALLPEKDVDGFHPQNVGLTTVGAGGFWPCTALGVLELLRHHAVDVGGRHVVVAGRSRVVGRPLATLLSQRGIDATVTLCHSASGDLQRYTRDADVVVMAVGRPASLEGGMIREGAVVVDVGIHRVPDPAAPGRTRLVGDVDAASVAPKAAWLSLVPGGVGPMTVACLMENTVAACERSLP
jgi:methylenetetrahydrofolate dehydrogenase (NADP+)/methenyltetrahydrofolate cyclohydrolase